jgi:hypothetical protein
MNKNASVTMAAAMTVAGILTLAVLTIAIQHQAFADTQGQGSKCCEPQQPPKCCEPQQPPKCCDNNDNNKKQESKEVAVGGNGGSGGAGGAGGEGGQGGKNVAEDSGKKMGDDSCNCCCKDPGKTKIDQDANGGKSNGGKGGNANGGDGLIS